MYTVSAHVFVFKHAHVSRARVTNTLQCRAAKPTNIRQRFHDTGTNTCATQKYTGIIYMVPASKLSGRRKLFLLGSLVILGTLITRLISVIAFVSSITRIQKFLEISNIIYQVVRGECCKQYKSYYKKPKSNYVTAISAKYLLKVRLKCSQMVTLKPID